ncbi:MAG: hypothetical protein JWL69_5249 [Phycisphaerales bacterium]|nr:hypothetical protein [Phycisphaerales bacterium]
MGRMSEWVLHRAKVLGMTNVEALADESGIALETVQTMLEADSLRCVSRSARAYLARALKVSVRDLESLDTGGANWIADNHQVDLDRHAPSATRSRTTKTPIPVSCPTGRGVPIVGRVISGGVVEHIDDPPAADGRRLDVRYPGLPDVFALELVVDVPPYSSGRFLAFQVIAPADVCAGELALLTRCDLPETRLCRVECVEAMTVRFLRPAPAEHPVPPVALSDIPRAARIIGTHK